MGNRAVITLDDNVGNIKELENRNDKIGIYVHWNGGLESVLAFLTYSKMQQFRGPINDNYGIARLCQIIANYFTDKYGHEGSIGIDTLNNLDCDNGDNGVYLIDNDWNITRRTYEYDDDQVVDIRGMLVDIDKHQPEALKLGEGKIYEWLKDNEPAKDLTKGEKKKPENIATEELLVKILEEHGFNVTLQDEEDRMYEASKYTPAGEDWSFTFSGVKGFEDYAFDFDPDDEFDMLYRSGLSGLPRPAELIEDQQWKKTTLDTIFQELNGHK